MIQIKLYKTAFVMIKRIFNIAVVAVLLLGLPLAGVLVSGRPVLKYMEFPPMTRYVEHAPFSLIFFLCLLSIVACTILFFDSQVMKQRRRLVLKSPKSKAAFPWWGWLGLCLLLVMWILAWNRFSWFKPFQVFAFSPLWFGYILVVNGLTLKRSGHCMLKDRPGYFFMLFVTSAVFWWFFEYLNRFVQNWYYVGIGTLSPIQYVMYATLPFSTVLPAVTGTAELFYTFPRIGVGLDRSIRIDVGSSSLFPLIVLVIACAGLFGISLWPDYLFFTLWLSPLLIITSLQALRGESTIFSDLKQGNVKRIYIMALAALICGFFWEMWNVFSFAKWHYTIPYVNRFKIFEMPLIGYAGYLPFGLECAVIADAVSNITKRNT